MQALMTPNIRGMRGPSVRDVTDRLQALVTPRREADAQAPRDASEVERRARPLGIHQLRAPMSRVLDRPAPARVAPWWMATVLLPAVAVIVAMVTLSS